MNYKYEDLKECTITRDMLLEWFAECYNENEGDVWEKDNINLEVKINGKELDNPLRYFEKLVDFIDKKVDVHCNTLYNFEKEIDELANEKAKELLKDKVYELQNKISEFLESDD